MINIKNKNSSSASVKTLVCWIGDTDILAMGYYGKKTQGEDSHYHSLARIILAADKGWDKEITEQEIDKLDMTIRDSSILLTLDGNTHPSDIPVFRKVLLLTNRPSEREIFLEELKTLYPAFVKQRLSLGGNFQQYGELDITVEFVPSADNPKAGVDPWNHAAVYRATRQVLDHCLTDIAPEDVWYNITPGTIAQQINLILLGKERQPRTENFIQVDKGRRRVSKCSIPFDFANVVEKAIEERTRHIEDDTLPIVGKAPVYLAALEKAQRAARYPVSVLLTGETGTGKEVFARMIHQLSGRTGKFIPINCAMLSRETGEAELTGFFKSAFTGADRTTPRYYEQAKNGTLFLDEIGDCQLDVQAELLRFLQPIEKEKPTMRHWKLKGAPPSQPKEAEKQYVGEQSGDILVIAATNRDVRDPKTFRQDLFYRLETIQVKIPSLEDRKRETNEVKGIDDIKDLADVFLAECNETFGFSERERRRLSNDAYDALRSHEWQGNVRELKNAISRMVVMSDSPIITAETVCANLDESSRKDFIDAKDSLKELIGDFAKTDVAGHGLTFDDRIAEIKKLYCQAALEATRGNKKKAYTTLKINPKTFDEWL